MKAKLLKNGSVVRVTEHELRLINQDGDAVDVLHCSSLEEALRGAKLELKGEVVAAVVELHVSYRPAHLAPDDADIYTTLAVLGDPAALEAGGWEGPK